MTYTIWYCCGYFDQFDEKEECLSYAVAAMNNDGHSVLAIEGPNHEDLMEEADERDRQYMKEVMQRTKEAPKPIGRVEIMGPKPSIKASEVVYKENEKVKLLAKYTEIYGAERVKWIEGQ